MELSIEDFRLGSKYVSLIGRNLNKQPIAGSCHSEFFEVFFLSSAYLLRLPLRFPQKALHETCDETKKLWLENSEADSEVLLSWFSYCIILLYHILPCFWSIFSVNGTPIYCELKFCILWQTEAATRGGL